MKKLASALAMAAAALCASAPAHADIVVSFVPTATTINIGESVTVDLTISGLGAEVLSGFDFNMLWSDTLLSITSGSLFCNYLGAGAGCSFDTVTPTNVGAIAYSVVDDSELVANQADTLTIARFTFEGASGGVATIGLGADPDFQRNFTGLLALTLPTTVVAAEICVRSDLGSTLPGQSCGGTPGIPEPASYGLAGVALFAAGLASRRRRTVKAA